MNNSDSHISTVKRIMFAILPKFGANRKIQYDLSKIAKRVRQNYSKLYSPTSGKVEPFFSEAVYKLMLDLEYFKPVLESSLGAENTKQLEQFQMKLLDRILHSKGLTLNMLKFDTISNEIPKASKGRIINIKDVFKVRYDSFTSLKTEKIHRSYQMVLQLWMLSSYNFKELLSSLQKKKRNKTIGFTSCFGDIILENLKDLYFLCSEFTPDKSGLKMLELILSIQQDSPVNEGEILAHYAGIQEFLETNVPLEALADIIKSSSLDPYIELKKQEINVNFIKEIQSDILASFNNTMAAFQKETSEKAYRLQITQLFQDHQLLTLEVYSSQVNKLLSSNGLPGLKYITALRLMKTFSKVFYIEQIQDVFLEFLDKVDFISPKYRKAVENSFRSSNELFGSILKFESDLADPKLSKLLPIITQYTSGNVKPEFQKQAGSTIDGINKLAGNIIEAGTSGLYNMMQSGIKSLEDIRSKTPEIVDNSRYIRDNEKEFLSKMENSMDKLHQFMNIMTHFSINREQAKQWKDNLKKGVIKYG